MVEPKGEKRRERERKRSTDAHTGKEHYNVKGMLPSRGENETEDALRKAGAKGEKLKCKRDDVRGKAGPALLFVPSPTFPSPHFAFSVVLFFSLSVSLSLSLTHSLSLST